MERLSANQYHDNLDHRTEPELQTLSEIKRFLEVYTADAALRSSIQGGVVSLASASVSLGLSIDLNQLSPAFDVHALNGGATLDRKRWPLAAIWSDYVDSLTDLRPRLEAEGDTGGVNRPFDRWRARQIRRTACDLGASSRGIVHPPIAFELSSGCSVGCWFCGISADKFSGHFTLAGGGEAEWRAILEASQAVLGRGVQSGFLYWATDPLDNPEYLEFLDTFHDVTGAFPQTTTAIPLRNKRLTMGVLKRWGRDQAAPNRFSILNLKVLRQVHAEFSPRELLHVEMVLQNFENKLNAKSNAGRTFKHSQAGGTSNTRRSTVVNGTIACVTGFLVNIVERRVRLVSPCMPSARYPDGFIVFAEGTYRTVAEYHETLREMIRAQMPLTMMKSDLLDWSENFRFVPSDGGPFLETPSMQINSAALESFGSFIGVNGSPVLSVMQRAVESGKNPFAVLDAIEKSRDAGLVDVRLHH